MVSVFYISMSIIITSEPSLTGWGFLYFIVIVVVVSSVALLYN